MMKAVAYAPGCMRNSDEIAKEEEDKRIIERYKMNQQKGEGSILDDIFGKSKPDGPVKNND
jgi:hypothetical protein